MIRKLITFFGEQCILACDARCDKAWGICARPRRMLSDDEDDYVYLADSELGVAPDESGTWEGEDEKPSCVTERLNKWCARQCERSVIAGLDKPIVLVDLEHPAPNIPRES